jgi:galactokinase
MRSEQLPLDLAEAGLDLLVVNTNAPHQLVDSEYSTRRRQCEQACAQLDVRALRDIDIDGLGEALGRLSAPVLCRRVRHVVSENNRVLRCAEILRNHLDPRLMGPLLTESHESLRDDYEVSCRELDLAVDTALNTGALGARMTGGGFGGSAIALVARDLAGSTETAVREAFEQERLAAPDIFRVSPASGTRQLPAHTLDDAL